jgi:hypothetical protein
VEVEVDGQVMESANVVVVDRLKATGLNTNLYCNVSGSTRSLVGTVSGDTKTAAAIGKASLLVEKRNNWSSHQASLALAYPRSGWRTGGVRSAIGRDTEGRAIVRLVSSDAGLHRRRLA